MHSRLNSQKEAESAARERKRERGRGRERKRARTCVISSWIIRELVHIERGSNSTSTRVDASSRIGTAPIKITLVWKIIVENNDQ